MLNQKTDDAKDAARYRYLRDLPGGVAPVEGLDVVYWRGESGQALRGDKLDATIDRMIEHGKPQG